MTKEIRKIFKKYNCKLLEYEFEYFPTAIDNSIDEHCIKVWIKFEINNRQSYEINYVIRNYKDFIKELDKCIKELVQCLN